MTTFDDARTNRINAARQLAEWRSLAADMLAEWKAFDEAVESKAIRYVKTPAGSKKYGEPIGAPIRPNAPKLSYVRNGPKKRNGGSAGGESSNSSRAESPTKPRIDYTRKTPKASNVVESSSPAEKPTPATNTAKEPETDKTKLAVNRLTDSELKKQARDFTNGSRKLSGAEQQRLNQLVTEERRRETLAGNGPAQRFTEDGLKKEISKLDKTKKRTTAQNRRLLELRLELSRRSYRAGQAQSLGLVDPSRLRGKSELALDARIDVGGKALALVGDGEWDCTDMNDDDLDWFLGKCLAGRPTVEKLTQANAMLTERASRVETDEPETKELLWENV